MDEAGAGMTEMGRAMRNMVAHRVLSSPEALLDRVLFPSVLSGYEDGFADGWREGRAAGPADVATALAALRGEPVSWAVRRDDPLTTSPIHAGSLVIAQLVAGGELMPVRVLWRSSPPPNGR